MTILLFLSSVLLAVLICYSFWIIIREQNIRIDLLSLIVDLDEVAKQLDLYHSAEHRTARSHIINLSRSVDIMNGTTLSFTMNIAAGTLPDKTTVVTPAFVEILELAMERCFSFTTSETLSGYVVWTAFVRKLKRQSSMASEYKAVRSYEREYETKLMQTKPLETVSC